MEISLKVEVRNGSHGVQPAELARIRRQPRAAARLIDPVSLAGFLAAGYDPGKRTWDVVTEI